MKRFIAILLSAGLLAGCGGARVSSGGAGGSPSQAVQVATSGEALSGEITVSSFNAMPHKQFLETAAALFEDKHPGVKIHVDVFSAMPEVRTMETADGRRMAMMLADDDESESRRPDYINRITTEMSSGGGPDLMAVDVLPYYQYALGGRIENLSDYMEADPAFNMADYRGNILDAMKINGNVYVMPLDYRFTLAAYDPSMFTQTAQDALNVKDRITYEEMAATAGLGFIDEDDARIFPMIGGEGMATAMFHADYSRYADVPNKTASFDDGNFAAMLELAKEYEDNGYVLPGNIAAQARSGNMQMTPGSIPPSAFKTVNNQMLMMYLTNYYDPNRTAGMSRRIMMNGSMLNEDDELIGPITNSNGDISFEFSQAYAINANSKNKALAWEFLKFLASEEAQTSGATALSGIPLNNNAAYAKAKLEAAGMGLRFISVGQAGGAQGDQAVSGDGARVAGGEASDEEQGQMTMRVRGEDGEVSERQISAEELAEMIANREGQGSGEGQPQMRIVGGEDENEGQPQVRISDGGDFGEGQPQMRIAGGEGQGEDQPQARAIGGAQPGGQGGMMAISGDIDLENLVLTPEQEKVLEEYLKIIEKYSNMLNTFHIKDSTVTSIVDAEVKNFFNGSRSAEEAARIIQNRAGLYLSE